MLIVVYILYIYQVYFILSLFFFSLFCFYRKENLLLYKEIVHSVCIVIKERILRSKSFGTPAFHVYIYVKDIKSIESLFRAGYIYDNCVSSSKITSVMLSDRAFPEFINPMKPRRNVARRSIGSHVYRLSSFKGDERFSEFLEITQRTYRIIGDLASDSFFTRKNPISTPWNYYT